MSETPTSGPETPPETPQPQASSTTSPARGRLSAPAGIVVVLGLLAGALVLGRYALARQDDRAAAPDTATTDDSQPAEDPPPENPFPRAITVPDGILDGGTGWLNTGGPISMRDLRGKVVILDFWTYCCINCMHVLPDLEYLEEKYPNELVVIGVHSAKFDNEKDQESIRKAIQRYEIAHPVINDSRMLVWRKFGANSWPTLAVVDPEGKFLGKLSGEGNRETLDEVVSRLVAYHGAVGTLDRTPVRFDLEREKLKPTPLRFPGKVLADEPGGRLFVADTNHNRIVVCTPDGKLIDVIGSGTIGLKDGGYEEARFDHPQGLALVGDTLYVADTENHALRTVNLTTRTVATLAGTGKQAGFRSGGGPRLETDLNSPWCLVHVDGVLYIGMAGPHQIWKYELGSRDVEVFAGNGREDVVDGPHDDSSFAQPSGITTDGKYLYICDSEGSSIRKLPINPREEVTTIVGEHDLPQGRTLFEFGDVDGVGTEARLQHPLGIAYADGTLYVADSYNHRVKRLTPEQQNGKPTGQWRSESWIGTGASGDALDPVQFAEPHGLAVFGKRLFIADTNNSRLLTAHLASGRVSEFTIDGLQPPVIEETPDDDGEVFAADKPFVGVEPQVVGANGELRFEVTLTVPEGYKWNEEFPVSARLRATDEQSLIAADQLDARRTVEVQDKVATVVIPLAEKTGKASLQLAVSYGYCSESGGLCKLKTARFRVPVEVSADGQRTAISLTAPQDAPLAQPDEE